MSRLSRGAVLALAATLLVTVALVEGVAARGGGRGGGGISRGGPAARGSFGRQQPARGSRRGNYNARGPAAYGNFYQVESQYWPMEDERQDQRGTESVDDGQGAPERNEDWQEYAEDSDEEYDDYDGGSYDEGVVYWTLPCKPNVIAMGGVTYYTCGSDWFIRAYDQGDVVYTPVPNPTGH